MKPPAAVSRPIGSTALAVIVALFCGSAVNGQATAPRAPAGQGARPVPAAPKPAAAPQGTFEVYEWVVLVCDPNQPAANAERMFQSTLPDFVGSRRPSAPATVGADPCPVGVIRLRREDEGAKVDVLLQAPGGRFFSQWPKGKGRTDRQLWEAYELHAAPPPALREIPPQHWFGALRDAASPYLQRGRAGDRFLLYDAEVKYPIPLQVLRGKGEAYELANSGAAPLHDLTVYRPQDGAWRTASVESMPAAKDAKAPVNPATGPSTAPAAVALPPGLPPELAAKFQAQRGSATAPATAPAPAGAASTQPSPGASKATVTLDAPPAGAAEALSPWRRRLQQEGLADSDVAVILRILERHALDKRRLTAVYRLDPAELDRMLPLEVTPTPRKTVRVGLMVARNIDPAVGDEIDQLVAQLADPDWEKRETAHKQLAELGPAARPKLQAVLQSKDLEVVWRAERLLQSSEVPPGPPRRR
jgi:hypothetical protein